MNKLINTLLVSSVVLIVPAIMCFGLFVSVPAYAKYATQNDVTTTMSLTINPAQVNIQTELNDTRLGSISPTTGFDAKTDSVVTIDASYNLSIAASDGTTHIISVTPSSSCYFDKWTIFTNGIETEIVSGTTKIAPGSTKVKAYFSKYECLKLENTSTANAAVNIGVECTQDDVSTKPNLQYSYDGSNWLTYTIPFNTDSEKATLPLAAGTCIYFKGNNPAYHGAEGHVGWSTASRVTYFTMSGTDTPCIKASGHIMSLISNGDCSVETPIERQYAFQQMFKDCKLLVSAKNLMLNKSSNGFATNLCSYIYLSMFEGCTNLVDAPELPAPEVSRVSTQVGLDAHCYDSMFKYCTSLKTAPALPVTKADEMASDCYREMFSGCTSLEAIPELNALSLKSNCYYLMFQGCISLTSAKLPATTMASSCYGYMFQNCSSLSRIEVAFTSWSVESKNAGFTVGWVDVVASSGTFICPESLTVEHAINRIPTGWAVNPFDASINNSSEAASIKANDIVIAPPLIKEEESKDSNLLSENSTNKSNNSL